MSSVRLADEKAIKKFNLSGAPGQDNGADALNVLCAGLGRAWPAMGQNECRRAAQKIGGEKFISKPWRVAE